MLTVQRNVYYCEFCKRYRLTKNAIEVHEPKCIKNPNRSVCGWHSGCPRPADFASKLAESQDLDWLHNEMDGCPACMLAVVVQAFPGGGQERWNLGFVYTEAVEEYRKHERAEESYAY